MSLQQDFSDLPINVFEEIPNLLDVSDRLLAFAQEIWVCFNTKEFENISDTKSGTLSLERIIFHRNVSSKQLTELVKNEIDNNTSGSGEFNYEVDVNFVSATIRDIVVIDVIVYDSNNRPLKQRFLFE